MKNYYVTATNSALANLTSTSEIFVKGFSSERHSDVLNLPPCQDNFYVIITDMETTARYAATFAKKQGENWFIIGKDGSSHSFRHEPSTPRQMTNGCLVTNFQHDPYGKSHKTVPVEEYASQDITSKQYSFMGFVNGQQILTSPLTKLWQDSNSKWHGFTKSGSHYLLV